MTDREFIVAFEQGTLEEFKHADHIRMAWIYLTTTDPEEAFERIVCGIQHFAAVKNATTLYHETITLFWICTVFAAIRRRTYKTFDQFLSANEPLTRKDHLFEYYSREVVFSDRARRAWVSP
ncbi:MAG: hypothetical protein ACRD4B_10550, partial [Acidobacteriota bacterium]